MSTAEHKTGISSVIAMEILQFCIQDFLFPEDQLWSQATRLVLAPFTVD